MLNAKRILIAICLSSLTPTTALADPPRHRWNQANCPKGFYKYRGDCWRKIDAEAQIEQDESSIDELSYDDIIELAQPTKAPPLRGRGSR